MERKERGGKEKGKGLITIRSSALKC